MPQLSIKDIPQLSIETLKGRHCLFPPICCKFLSISSWLKVIMTVLHALVIGTTSFRLHYRYRTSLLGWDDFWAAISLMFDIIYLASSWIFVQTIGMSLQISYLLHHIDEDHQFSSSTTNQRKCGIVCARIYVFSMRYLVSSLQAPQWTRFKPCPP